MAKSLLSLRNELAARLPQATVVAADFRTDNLVVHDGARGFVITRYVLDNWSFNYVVEKAQKALDDLIAGKDGSDDGLKFYSLKELRDQASGPTTFDEAS